MTTWIKGTAATLLLVMAAVSLPARAELVSTRSALAEEEGQAAPATLSRERAELRSFLARADIKTQLSQMGVDPADASQRVASLTDEQVQTLHGRLQQLPAGGDIIGAVVFVFLVLLITDILGLTHVFPFTRSIRH